MVAKQFSVNRKDIIVVEESDSQEWIFQEKRRVKVDIDDSLQHRTNLESIIQILAMNTGNMWEYNGNQIKIRSKEFSLEGFIYEIVKLNKKVNLKLSLILAEILQWFLVALRERVKKCEAEIVLKIIAKNKMSIQHKKTIRIDSIFEYLELGIPAVMKCLNLWALNTLHSI
ncbi:hypothetical protein HZH68_000997 [Vespula germanica]|uniref:Uncharacterized protein n=1 Tax=Vespula germanica TaxID=30212 RepID=A0A834NV87_VESGE|nr:hypothetical protein HZH68_000997 [Vespula germanica]